MAFAPNRRITILVLAAVVLAVYFVLAPRWPHDQVVHVVLGASAPRVTELRIRYAPLTRDGRRTENDEDWTREVSFRFAEGSAPRVVTHEPRLADGDYAVEMEIESGPQLTQPKSESKSPMKSVAVERRITLQGGTTSIDLAEAVPR